MVTGIAVFGVLTANIAAFFIQREEHDKDDPVSDKLDELLQRMESLEQRLAANDAV